MPVISFGFLSVNIMTIGGEGFLILVAFIAIFALNTFTKEFKITEKKAINISRISILVAIGMWALLIYRALNTASTISSFGVKIDEVFKFIGIGFYLINLSLIAELFLLLVYKNKKSIIENK